MFMKAPVLWSHTPCLNIFQTYWFFISLYLHVELGWSASIKYIDFAQTWQFIDYLEKYVIVHNGHVGMQQVGAENTEPIQIRWRLWNNKYCLENVACLRFNLPSPFPPLDALCEIGPAFLLLVEEPGNYTWLDRRFHKLRITSIVSLPVDHCDR